MSNTVDPSELVIIDGNPAPEGIVASSYRTPDGRRLRYAVAPSTAASTRGTVLILQGRNETIEKYFETIGDLNRRGFMVATFDWRGQGGSERLLRNRRRGHVRSFANYLNDLESFVQDVLLPDCRGPFSILAHSMGGLIALHASPRLVNVVERMVLCAPLVDLPPRRIGSRGLRRVTTPLRLLGLGRLPVRPDRMAGRMPASPTVTLTSDPGRGGRNRALAEAAPWLFLGSPSIAWLNAMTGAMRRLEDSNRIARLTLPTLFVTAGADEVVSTPAAERLAWRMRSASSVAIPFAHHEILQEADRYRDQILEAFETFVETALPLPKTEPAAPALAVGAD